MSFHSFHVVAMVASALLALANLSQVGNDPKEAKPAATKHQHAEGKLPTAGVARLLPMQDSKVHGQLWLTQSSTGLQIKGEVKGLTPGLHGFHIHEFGDLSDPQGKSAGGHFNPEGKEHGGPDTDHRHAGDLGNIKADEAGVAIVDMNVAGLKLHSILGRSFVVHADADDLKSQPAGNSGDRVAVGVIGVAQSKEKMKSE